MTDARKVADALLAAPKWKLVSHVKPDGDTLGSCSALFAAGVALGKQVSWCGADPMPYVYTFLPHADEYRRTSRLEDDGSCIIAVDVSSPDRGIAGMSADVLIDHHLDNVIEASARYVDPSSAAVGEIMYEVILALGCPIDKAVAEGLYVAIVTDSGKFSFSNTTPNTFRVAAELLKLGVQPQYINEKLYHNRTPEKLRLWGRCFSRVERVGRRCLLSWLTHDDFLETGTPGSDSEGLVNELTTVGGVDLTVFVVETPEYLRVSYRSQGDLSARDFAQAHGGGGHLSAAGCKLFVPLDEGLALLRKEMSDV